MNTKSILATTLKRIGTRKQFASLIKYPLGSINRHLTGDMKKIPLVVELGCAYILWSIKTGNPVLAIDKEEALSQYLAMKNYKHYRDTAKDVGLDKATVQRLLDKTSHSKHVLYVLAIQFLTIQHINKIKQIKGEETDDTIDAIERRIRENRT